MRGGALGSVIWEDDSIIVGGEGEASGGWRRAPSLCRRLGRQSVGGRSPQYAAPYPSAYLRLVKHRIRLSLSIFYTQINMRTFVENTYLRYGNNWGLHLKPDLRLSLAISKQTIERALPAVAITHRPPFAGLLTFQSQIK